MKRRKHIRIYTDGCLKMDELKKVIQAFTLKSSSHTIELIVTRGTCTGKTHLAIAIAANLVRQGSRGHF